MLIYDRFDSKNIANFNNFHSSSPFWIGDFLISEQLKQRFTSRLRCLHHGHFGFQKTAGNGSQRIGSRVSAWVWGPELEFFWLHRFLNKAQEMDKKSSFSDVDVVFFFWVVWFFFGYCRWPCHWSSSFFVKEVIQWKGFAVSFDSVLLRIYIYTQYIYIQKLQRSTYIYIHSFE